jgi:transcriptional regulator with XRE-family HTH domain
LEVFIVLDSQFIANNIKQECLLKGVSVNQALSDSGVDKNFVFGMKHGRIPSVEGIARLAKYLGISIDKLVGYEIQLQTPQERALEAYLALPANERKAFIQEAIKHI